MENASSAFEKPDTSEELEQIAELERMVEQLTVQLEIVKKVSSILHSTSSKKGNCDDITHRLPGNRIMCCVGLRS